MSRKSRRANRMRQPDAARARSGGPGFPTVPLQPPYPYGQPGQYGSQPQPQLPPGQGAPLPGATPSGAPYATGSNLAGTNSTDIALYEPQPPAGASVGPVTPGNIPAAVMFPPGDPIRPVPGLTDGFGGPRQWSYPAGVNITPVPRHTESTTFAQLRALAEAYDAIQLCEEVIFRILDRLELQVVPHPDVLGADDDASDDKWLTPARLMRDWLLEPHADYDLHSWMRAGMRELLELDALGIYHERTRAGYLYGLRPINGETLSPLYNAAGGIPQFPAPAYLQVIAGTPADLLLARDLDYLRINPRVGSRYGRSPVDMIILRVNQALRKQHYDLSLSTDGSTPEGVLETDNPQLMGITADQLMEMQHLWDGYLAGMDQLRVRVKMVAPGWHYTATKIREINPEFDGWLLNVTCGAFGISKEELGITDTSNRSTGATQEDMIYRNAVRPKTDFFARYLTKLIRRYDGTPLCKRASATSYAARPTKQTKGTWDARFLVRFGGIEEPTDWNQRAFALKALAQGGIIGPTEVKQLLKLPIKPGEQHVPPYVLAPSGMDSVVFMTDMLAKRDQINAAQQAQLQAKGQMAQQQTAMGANQQKLSDQQVEMGEGQKTLQQQAIQKGSLDLKQQQQQMKQQADQHQVAMAQAQTGQQPGQPGTGQKPPAQASAGPKAGQAAGQATTPKGLLPPQNRPAPPVLVGGTTTKKQPGGGANNASGTTGAPRGQALGPGDGPDDGGWGVAWDDDDAVGSLGDADRGAEEDTEPVGLAGTGLYPQSSAVRLTAGGHPERLWAAGALGRDDLLPGGERDCGDSAPARGERWFDAGPALYHEGDRSLAGPRRIGERSAAQAAACGLADAGDGTGSDRGAQGLLRPGHVDPPSRDRAFAGVGAAGAARTSRGGPYDTRSTPSGAEAEAVSDEWRAWRDKALRAAKKGQSQPTWEPQAIPQDEHAWVSARLAWRGGRLMPDEVRAVFEQARSRDQAKQDARGDDPGSDTHEPRDLDSGEAHKHGKYDYHYHTGDADHTGAPLDGEGWQDYDAYFAQHKAQQQHRVAAKKDSDPTANHTGIMVAFLLPQDAAQQLAQRRDEDLRWGDDIKRAKPDEMHVTLAYLGDKTDPVWTPQKQQTLRDTVADFAADQQPFSGRIASIGRFHNGAKAGPTSDEGDAVHGVVDSAGIQQFRKALVATLKAHDLPVDETFHDYKPHVTLAYIPPDEPTPPIELPDTPIPFRVVTVAIGDDQSHHVLGTEQGWPEQRIRAADPLAELVERLGAMTRAQATEEARVLRTLVVQALEKAS